MKTSNLAYTMQPYCNIPPRYEMRQEFVSMVPPVFTPTGLVSNGNGQFNDLPAYLSAEFRVC